MDTPTTKSAHGQPAVEAASERELLDDALSAILWLQRRLPEGYGLLPFVGRTIKALGAATGVEVREFLEADHFAARPVPPEGQEAPDLAKLKALALAATPGPWEVRHETDDDCYHAGYTIHAESGKAISDDGTAPGDKDALFIAAANPAVVLDLIDRVSRLSLPVEAGEVTDQDIESIMEDMNWALDQQEVDDMIKFARAILKLAGERG